MSNDVRRARGTLEMEIEGRAPAGVLTDDDGRRLEFSGWTELAAAIEEWRSDARARSGAEGGAEALRRSDQPVRDA